MGEAPLAVRNLSKTYAGWPLRRRVRALEDLSFSVGEGEVLGLAGPNGSGKTTAIRCALGLLRPSRGEVRRFGARATDLAARRGIGYAPERFALAPARSAFATLDLLGALDGIAPSDRRRRIGELLDRFELADSGRRPLREFSKGMTRRLAIAAALLPDPRLLVLDEPFDGLDPLGVLLVRDEVERLRARGVAVLLSSHQLADLEAVATHVLVLDRGRALVAGPIAEVLAREGVVEMSIEGLDAAALAALAGDAAARGGRVVATRPARESLEALFRSRVGRDRDGRSR